MSASALQICNGLAAGNIGDEFMNRAFWQRLEPGTVLEVELLPNRSLQRQPYPARHIYRSIDWAGDPVPTPTIPGLLVGDTPVTDTLGVDWPLRFLERRLRPFHQAGLPVDAVGIGAEPLRTTEGRAIFERSLKPIRSWTVRSERSRDILLQLGVDTKAVVVGADWAWLYEAEADRSDWASALWSSLGASQTRPLVVVNCVNEIWAGHEATKRALAAVLDDLVTREGAQVAFFCNEMRDGPFYDREAALAVQESMTQPSIMVPNEYYSPDEVLALLSRGRLVVSGRYHMTIESVLAGVVPVTFSRSAKMAELLEDLDAPSLGSIEGASFERMKEVVSNAWADHPGWASRLQASRRRLAVRATVNAAAWLAATP